MKNLSTMALALLLLGGTVAIAQPNFSNRADQGRDRNDRDRNDRDRDGRDRDGRGGQDRYDQFRNNPGVRMGMPRFSRGDRVPDQYRRDRRYVVNDWQQRHLRRPPRGYHWVRDDNDNYFLAAITTGVILDLLLNSR